MEMLELLKSILGIAPEDNSRDALVKFALQEAEEVALNYCNLTEIPLGLQTTLLRMALDFYRCQNLGKLEEAEGAVSSIKEGDTSVNFTGIADFKNGILDNYKAQLNRYRKVGWP